MPVVRWEPNVTPCDTALLGWHSHCVLVTHAIRQCSADDFPWVELMTLISLWTKTSRLQGRPRMRGAQSITAACIGITLITWGVAISGDVELLCAAWLQHHYLTAGKALLFVAMVSALVYGSLVYQAARLGYLQRMKRHRRP